MFGFLEHMYQIRTVRLLLTYYSERISEQQKSYTFMAMYI